MSDASPFIGDAGQDFQFYRDTLKHYVRRNAWLPLCAAKLQALRQGRQPSQYRRLRYFSFCATTAIDVLMLDVEHIIRLSRAHTFDTVCFFNRSAENVADTELSIPGAIGFAGDFVETVNLFDPGEDNVTAVGEFYEEVRNVDDTYDQRRLINLRQVRREFMQHFPFDVVNLDLERYPFRPSEPIPGELIRALRKVLEWQKRPLETPGGRVERLAGFGLLYTAKLGPDNLPQPYLDMLSDNVRTNLERDASLIEIMATRTGYRDPVTLQGLEFQAFFKLATPKVLAQVIWDEDWYIDPEYGVHIYEFERTPPNSPPYRMLHFAFNVLRQDPPKEQRAVGSTYSGEAADAYPTVMRGIFERSEVRLTPESISTDVAALEQDLEQIAARRRHYRERE